MTSSTGDFHVVWYRRNIQATAQTGLRAQIIESLAQIIHHCIKIVILRINRPNSLIKRAENQILGHLGNFLQRTQPALYLKKRPSFWAIALSRGNLSDSRSQVIVNILRYAQSFLLQDALLPSSNARAWRIFTAREMRSRRLRTKTPTMPVVSVGQNHGFFQ